ncbi:hypothetical protein Barb4_03519 [Bacteroidales bacterium Barb4]|nr:hypothetical protein Barb4_03519 [Bacteroidales bacterium Barb4]
MTNAVSNAIINLRCAVYSRVMDVYNSKYNERGL